MPNANDAEFYDVELYILDMLDKATAFGITSRQLFGSTWTIPKETLFENLTEVQVYVDRITGSAWAREKWPKKAKRVIVERAITGKEDEGVYSGNAYYQNRKIFIPDHGAHGRSTMMREMYVLHELAHYYGEANHKEKFRTALLDLIDHQMDPMFAAFYRICLSTGPDNIGR